MFPVWDAAFHFLIQIQQLSQSVTDVCEQMRQANILSFHFSHFPPLLWVLQQNRMGDPSSRGRAGTRGETRREAGCRGADTAELFCGPDFIYETRARMDHRPAGRPTCCSCPGNTQQWSMGIYRHQLNLSPFLPLPLWFLTLPLS